MCGFTSESESGTAVADPARQPALLGVLDTDFKKSGEPFVRLAKETQSTIDLIKVEYDDDEQLAAWALSEIYRHQFELWQQLDALRQRVREARANAAVRRDERPPDDFGGKTPTAAADSSG